MTVPRIIRSRRQSVALVVTRDAQLVVRAPWRLPENLIERFVAEKKDWIERKIRETHERRGKMIPKQFVPGETFLFLGEKYALRISDEAGKIRLQDQEMIFPRIFLPSAREHLVAWYRREALAVISARVTFFAEREGFIYRKIRISAAQRRWGSCSARGGLNFSWRLVMLPMSVVDYLVVHELCHLRHRDHSARYWDMVRTVMPSFREAETFLRSCEDDVVI